MKLLWVKAGGLLPPDMGGKIRSYHILKQLARRHEDHPLHLLPATSRRPASPRATAIFAQDRARPAAASRRAAASPSMPARPALMAAGRPVTIDKFLSPEVRRRYAELLASSAFDLIVCDFIVPGALMHWNTPPPTILFTHNVEAQVWERHYKVASNPFVKTACWLEARALATRRAPLCASWRITSWPSRKTIAPFFSNMSNPTASPSIPTGVDTEYFQPSAQS